jgi:Putative N-acetylmannosamine-6-phosphate epimerase
VRDITQIKEVVNLPVIGIIKKDYPGTPMYINCEPIKEVEQLVACSVNILAVQGHGSSTAGTVTNSDKFIRDNQRQSYPVYSIVNETT